MDEVFKALADASRRQLLDRLNLRNGQSLRELCAGLAMARQSVSKHLAVLEAANLITVVWHGREKLHYLNAVPINAIAERWINAYDRDRANALADLKIALEGAPMGNPQFVYTTYIDTTPERLWQALTEPAFTRRYWNGVAMRSDWKPGSRLETSHSAEEDFADHGQVVLEADPYRRLSYTWETYTRAHADRYGWGEEQFAELAKQPRSKVTFEIEPNGGLGVGGVKLTVLHDDLEPDGVLHRMVSGTYENAGGWPEVVASLKTMLETGDPLPAPSV